MIRRAEDLQAVERVSVEAQLARLPAPLRSTQTLGETLGDRPPFGENAFDEAPVRPETLPPCKRQVRGASPLFEQTPVHMTDALVEVYARRL